MYVWVKIDHGLRPHKLVGGGGPVYIPCWNLIVCTVFMVLVVFINFDMRNDMIDFRLLGSWNLHTENRKGLQNPIGQSAPLTLKMLELDVYQGR